MASSAQRNQQQAQAAVKQPNRLKRIFWYMAPIQSSVVIQATNDILVAESYPSPRVSTAGHVFYACLWVFAVAAYSVFVTYQHFTLPDSAAFMHEPANQQPMPEVTVEAWCSRLGQCGKFTIIANYSDAPAWCQQPASAQFNKTFDAFDDMKQRSWTFPLCYTGESVYSTYNDRHMPGKLGLIVDFESINVSPNLRPDPSVATPVPYVYPPAAAAEKDAARAFEALDHHATASTSTAVVRLTGPGGLNRTVNLDAWQVKTVVMGQSVTYSNKAYDGATVFPLAVQYEGRRPSLRATAVISLAEFADVTRVEAKKGDTTFRGLMSLLGVMCGMAFMMNSCQIFIEPVIVKLFPGPATIAANKAADEAAATSGMEAGLLSSGAAGEEELVPVRGPGAKTAAPMPPTITTTQLASEEPTSNASSTPEERGGAIDPLPQAAESTHFTVQQTRQAPAEADI